MNNSINQDYYSKCIYTKTVEKHFGLHDVLRHMRFNEANVLKYIVQHNDKNQDVDLKAARKYIEYDERTDEAFTKGTYMCLTPMDIPKAVGKFVLHSLREEEMIRLDHNSADLCFAMILWNYGLQVADTRFTNVCRAIVDNQLKLLLKIRDDIPEARTFQEYLEHEPDRCGFDKYGFIEFAKRCYDTCELSADLIFDLECECLKEITQDWGRKRGDL